MAYCLDTKKDSVPSNSDLVSDVIELLFIVIGICSFILSIVFSAGFVRLACLKGEERQSLFSLWRAGIRFFWRMIGIDCLMLIAVAVVLTLLRIPFNAFGPSVTGINITDIKQISFPYVLYASLIILMKPIIYMRSLIISQDCGIRVAWKLMRSFRLLAAPQLPILYLVLVSMTATRFAMIRSSTHHSVFLESGLYVVGQFIVFVLLLDCARVVGNPSTQDGTAASSTNISA